MAVKTVKPSQVLVPMILSLKNKIYKKKLRAEAHNIIHLLNHVFKSRKRLTVPKLATVSQGCRIQLITPVIDGCHEPTDYRPADAAVTLETPPEDLCHGCCECQDFLQLVGPLSTTS